MTWIIESKNLIVAAFIIINCMSLGLMMIKCEIIYRSNYEYASFKQNNSSKKKLVLIY